MALKLEYLIIYAPTEETKLIKLALLQLNSCGVVVRLATRVATVSRLWLINNEPARANTVITVLANHIYSTLCSSLSGVEAVGNIDSLNTADCLFFSFSCEQLFIVYTFKFKMLLIYNSFIHSLQHLCGSFLIWHEKVPNCMYSNYSYCMSYYFIVSNLWILVFIYRCKFCIIFLFIQQYSTIQRHSCYNSIRTTVYFPYRNLSILTQLLILRHKY